VIVPDDYMRRLAKVHQVIEERSGGKVYEQFEIEGVCHSHLRLSTRSRNEGELEILITIQPPPARRWRITIEEL